MTAPARVFAGVPVLPADVQAVAQQHQWVPAGPAAMLHGDGRGRPRVAGRVTALAVSADGIRVYLGTAQGGMWYSADGGESWSPLDHKGSTKDAANVRRFNDPFCVGAISVAWGTAANADVVYAGTGEHPKSPLEPPGRLIQGIGVRAVTGVASAGAAETADVWRVEAEALVGLAVNQFASDGNDLWAATSAGVYKRTAGPPVAWNKVAALGDAEYAGVVVTAGALTGEAKRIYVVTSTGQLSWSTNGIAFTAVTLPPSPDFAASLAFERVRMVAGNFAGRARLYVLANGPRLWRVDQDTADIVTGVPAELDRSDTQTAQPAGLCIAVHPLPDREILALGGPLFVTGTDPHRQAALYLGQINKIANVYTLTKLGDSTKPADRIGDGVPAGARTLAWSPATPAGAPQGATHLWVGTDAGAFRSDQDGANGTFKERNTGLAVADLIALAQSPDADAVMLASTEQGLLRRESEETWWTTLTAPVGGVAVDPAKNAVMYAQTGPARWKQSNDGGRTFGDIMFANAPANPTIAQKAAFDAALQAERERSARVSRPGLIAVPDSVVGTQIAIGSNRVWYTDEQRRWSGGGAAAWVTLPSGSNPYSVIVTGGDPLTQDALDGPVVAAVWGSGTRLYVMTTRNVYLLDRRADGTWNPWQVLYDRVTRLSNDKNDQLAPIPTAQALTAIAVHQVSTGVGTLYVGTTGVTDQGHLWWFDGQGGGAGQWIDTGFRQGESVFAVLVDPEKPADMYIGSDSGVWKGTFNAGPPLAWQWSAYSIGLPAARCVDLALCRPADGGPRMLRAALAGRGVWEVALDGAHQEAPAIYLRSHRFDVRRKLDAATVARDPFSRARRVERLDASPDIRIRRAPTARRPEPRATESKFTTPAYDRYAIGAGSDPHDQWLAKTGLRASGEDVDPNEPWSPRLSAMLKKRFDALVGANQTHQRVWEDLLVNNPMPLDRRGDFADFVVNVRDEPDRWPKRSQASCASEERALVHVTVHSRHWQTIAADTISVALLRIPFSGRRSLAGTPDLPQDWGKDVRANLAALQANFWQASQWQFADPNNRSQRVTRALDPRTPQVVSFDITLPANDNMPWCEFGWLFLAVVIADGDPDANLPSERNLAKLLRSDRRVAARSLRQALLMPMPLTIYPGFDTSEYSNQGTMQRAWRDSNLMFAGVYLDSPLKVAAETRQPAPPSQPPGSPAWNIVQLQGHRRAGGGLWMNAPVQIWPSWGLLPIYWGQQHRTNGNLDVHGPATLVRAGNTITLTVNAPDAHGCGVGQRITIAGASERHYNGIFTVVTVPNAQTLTYNVPAATPAGNPTGSISVNRTDHWVAVGPWHLDANALGLPNAADAESKARTAQLKPGSVIYVDWEVGDIDAVRQPGSNALRAITNMVAAAGNVVTVTVSSPHGLQNGNWVEFSGSPIAAYNARFAIGGVTAQTFNINIAVVPPTAAQLAGMQYDAWHALRLDFTATANDGVPYLRTLWRRIAEFGYRPGLYARTTSAKRLREECPALACWHAQSDRRPGAILIGSKLVFRTVPMVQTGDFLARQWLLDFPQPTGNTIGIFSGGDADADVSWAADPSFPERRLQARLVRRGRASAVAGLPGQVVAYAIRKGVPVVAAGTLPAMSTLANVIPKEVAMGQPQDGLQEILWNPLIPGAALRLPPAAVGENPTDAFIAVGYFDGEDGDAPQVVDLRRQRGAAWTHEVIPDAGFPIDPLPGVNAVSRGDQTIDVFAVVDPEVSVNYPGQLVGARWTPVTRRWTQFVQIPQATVRRTNRFACVSRDIGIATLFWVDETGELQFSEATAPANWSAPASFGPPSGATNLGGEIDVHRFSNIVALSPSPNRIDVFFVGRLRTSATTDAWHIYRAWWTSAAGWGNAAAPQWEVAVDGVTPTQAGQPVLYTGDSVDALAPIAACYRGANSLDLFYKDLSNRLRYTTFTQGAATWPNFPHPEIVSNYPVAPTDKNIPRAIPEFIEAVCSHGAGDVQVIVTCSDGNVYGSNWNASGGVYSALTRIAALDI